MRGIHFIFILIISISATSCGTLISTDQAKSSYTPIDRSFYAQSRVINKTLFAENKLNEVKPVSPKREKTAIEEITDIHKMFTHSFVSQLLSEAESYLGVPYRYGGNSRKGIDCSAFVQSVFQIFDHQLPRVSAAQSQEGYVVSNDELRAGDLVFFATNGRGRVSHVGIVHNVSDEGDVEFIHASTSQGVIVTPLKSDYWAKRYLYAKRIID
ncbi:MAG TPA: NlpC/P60 family protein [Moheibacter sp.]|nr:NlpC/P60 family protein [Moheibacter sp.]